MNNRLVILFIIVLCWACSTEDKGHNSTNNSGKESAMLTKMEIKSPVCPQKKKELENHGDLRIDNYYWLRERENPEVISYLNQENDYRKNMMSHTTKFQDQLYEEIVGRIKQDDSSVPYKDNGYYRYTRYEEGKEHPIYCRKKDNMDSKEEILMNVNIPAKAFDYYVARSLNISPNNNLMVFGEDTLSRRIYTLKFQNLETGEFYPDEIPNTTGYAVWANDNKTVFYTAKEEGTLRSYKIFRHVLGTPASQDEELFHEADETFSCYVYKSKSKKYLTIGTYQTLSSEFWVLNADNPTGDFKLVQAREKDHEYSISHHNDKFYIRTNWEAKNFRLMSTPVDKTSKENWTEVIPHRNDILLQNIELFDNHLVTSERVKGISNLRIISNNGDDHYIDFGEDSYLAYISVNPEFDTDIIRVGYQSMTTPPSTFDYNMKSKKMNLLKQQEVVGDFSSSNYTSERKYIKARDGVEVPVSIVYKKGLKKNGQAPCLLYAYGSYGSSMEPYFSSVRLSLLDRGFVYAIAHIRGGQEMGRQWYEDGKLLKKKNTFTDFVDCAKGLINQKYTNSDKLFAMGGSAGGLLMGAVVNMEPELFKGVVAAVPFVDVVTTMLDDSIPLTTGEYDEWGNPNEEQYYKYMKSYSPYDNVDAKNYPAMLVTTGLHDSQVQYWEPAKWVAKMRELKTDNNPLLLYCNMETGHGGASGRFARHKETAMEYAFVLDLAGLNDTYLN